MSPSVTSKSAMRTRASPTKQARARSESDSGWGGAGLEPGPRSRPRLRPRPNALRPSEIERSANASTPPAAADDDDDDDFADDADLDNGVPRTLGLAEKGEDKGGDEDRFRSRHKSRLGTVGTPSAGVAGPEHA